MMWSEQTRNITLNRAGGGGEFNDALSLDKLGKHKLAEQPLLPKPFRD